MKDFEGTTYQEWLEHSRKVTTPLIVDALLNNQEIKKMPIYFEVKKEK